MLISKSSMYFGFAFPMLATGELHDEPAKLS